MGEEFDPSGDQDEASFDFDGHRAHAVDVYKDVFPLYSAYAVAVRSIVKECLEAKKLRVHSIEARGKDVESFGRKASAPSDSDANTPKYPDPLRDITDLAGVRVITFFLDTLHRVNSVIEEEFHVLEKTDKSATLAAEERLGYQSIHYLLQLGANRAALPEYRRFQDMVAEVQVRTILQHAWAEIEHDINYKSIETVPASVRRRFIALAGVIEIADREFQAIDDENQRIQEEANASVVEGRLEGVEITPSALKAYLDKRLGPDGRMTDWSYRILALQLRQLGFHTIEEVETATSQYDDDRISRIAYRGRMGQISRLEGMLLAALGNEYIERHPVGRSGNEWWKTWNARRLDRLREAGIEVGWYSAAMVESPGA